MTGVLMNDRFWRILLKKSDFQMAWTQAQPPPENLLTTLSGFSALRWPLLLCYWV